MLPLQTLPKPTPSAQMAERKTRCTVLEAEQLPAGVAALDAALADVDADALAHGGEGGCEVGEERLERRRMRSTRCLVLTFEAVALARLE